MALKLKSISIIQSTIYGHESQYVQLITNLLQNALYATKDNPAQGKKRQIVVGMGPKTAIMLLRYVIMVWESSRAAKKGIRSLFYDQGRGRRNGARAEYQPYDR